MSTNSVKYHAAIVLDVLNANGHADAATAIRRLIADLDVEQRIDKTLNEMMGYCNVRALGDLYIGTLTGNAWLKVLDKLERACKRTLRARGVIDDKTKLRRARTEDINRRR